MSKSKAINQAKKKVIKAREESPGEVDWELCVSTIESLHEWIEELCSENLHLKRTLKNVIERIEADNEKTRAILKGINLPNLDSTDNKG